MNDYLPGNKIKYNENVVGIIKRFGSHIVMEWNQEPLRKLSNKNKRVYGMGIELKKKIEKSNIDYIEIDNGTIPVSVLDSYDVLSKNDNFFNSTIAENQILIEIPE